MLVVHAIATFKEWKYKPYLVSRRPVEISTRVAMKFDPTVPDRVITYPNGPPPDCVSTLRCAKRTLIKALGPNDAFDPSGRLKFDAGPDRLTKGLDRKPRRERLYRRYCEVFSPEHYQWEATSEVVAHSKLASVGVPALLFNASISPEAAPRVPSSWIKLGFSHLILPQKYGRTAGDLAPEMNAWRDRALSNQESTATST